MTAFIIYLILTNVVLALCWARDHKRMDKKLTEAHVNPQYYVNQ